MAGAGVAAGAGGVEEAWLLVEGDVPPLFAAGGGGVTGFAGEVAVAVVPPAAGCLVRPKVDGVPLLCEGVVAATDGAAELGASDFATDGCFVSPNAEVGLDVDFVVDDDVGEVLLVAALAVGIWIG